MANQRKKGKSQVSAWVTEDVAGRVKKIAETEDRPVSDVVNDILREWIAKEEESIKYGKSKRSH
jgi:hypothetical protein